MKRGIPAPTVDEAKRIDAFRHIGCIVMRVFYKTWAPYQVHHITERGRALGQRQTIPLSPYHHQGIPKDGMTVEGMELIYGPSLAVSKARFEMAFGTELHLLELTDKLLEKYA